MLHTDGHFPVDGDSNLIEQQQQEPNWQEIEKWKIWSSLFISVIFIHHVEFSRKGE